MLSALRMRYAPVQFMFGTVVSGGLCSAVIAYGMNTRDVCQYHLKECTQLHLKKVSYQKDDLNTLIESSAQFDLHDAFRVGINTLLTKIHSSVFV